MPVRMTLQNMACRDSTHAGLWLDKYLARQTDPDVKIPAEAKSDLVREVTDTVHIPVGYREFLACWRAYLSSCDHVEVAEAKVLGRMVVGLGHKGVLEAGLRLDHTWGVPVIPASALKGLAARVADLHLDAEGWRRSGASYQALFGTTDEDGAVAFLDAWWLPTEQDRRLPLHQDTITVHHAQYYGSSGSLPPLDTEEPTPVPFVSASGAYLLALQGPAAWTAAAMELLKLGLSELGVGAKTSSGYGRLEVRWESSSERERAAEAERTRRERQALERLDRLLERVHTSTAKEQVPRVLDEVAGDSTLLATLARRIIDRLESQSKGWLAERATTDKHRPWIRRLFDAAGREP